MADTQEISYNKAQKLELPIYVSNDSDSVWKGDITIAIYNNEEKISEASIASEVENYKVDIENKIVELPKVPGSYQLQVSLIYDGETVTSYRNLNVK